MVKWVTGVADVPLNSFMFGRACENLGDNVELVQWLSSNVETPLSDEDVLDSFIEALAKANTAVASWLDAKFHIMGATQELAVDGVKWLLNHPAMAHVEERFVVKAVRHLVFKSCMSTIPLFIIEKVPISEPHRNELVAGLLHIILQCDTLTQVQKVVSMGEFDKETVAKCLTSTDYDQHIQFSSSKVVKWLITHFQLERHHITLNNNALLLNLLIQHHSSCAEWLINMFHFSLDEVIVSTSFHSASILVRF
ncbi:hypothetical protein Pelo_19340 [Pelomyxa schiedti]|nr:hypothetical protein Pelo_19340 [Pelomyxa schiedti]